MKLIAGDGGGVRGLVAAVLADQLERRLGRTLHELVDRFAGTSAGCILACAFASGRTGAEALALLPLLAARAFPHSLPRRLGSRLRRIAMGPSVPWYDGHGLDDVLRDLFDPMLFGDLPVPVTATAYDRLRGEFLVLHSDEPGPWQDVPVWEVCRASAAAPGYLPAHETVAGGRRYALVDGGLGANNPAGLLVARALAMGASRDDLRLVSIGTGNGPYTVPGTRGVGFLQYAPHAVPEFLEASSQAHGITAEALVPGLVRLSMVLPASLMALDDSRPEHLRRLRKAAAARVDAGAVARAAEALG